ncbi:MAG: periplasmic heavy metal sensor [Hasllibacter sp.]
MGRLRIALIASVALNLVLLAGAAGWMLADGPRGGGRGPGGFGPLGEALGPAERRAVGRRLAGAGPELLQGRRADRAALAALADALEAEPFDPGAVDAILADHGARLAQRVRRGPELIGAVLREADPVARAAYAARLREALERWPRGRP